MFNLTLKRIIVFLTMIPLEATIDLMPFAVWECFYLNHWIRSVCNICMYVCMLHRGSSNILSAAALLPYCCYSASYFIVLFWSPIHGLLSDNATPSLWLVWWLGMVSRFRCIWRQWATLLYFSLALRPQSLTEFGLWALVSRLPWRSAI